MPVLYLLAGPNGTGKTTFYTTALEIGIISNDLAFINVDLITKSLGAYSFENFARASEIYRDRVRQHLDKQEDFMIESNLADSRDYDWILNMKKYGYHVVLYYLSTDDVEINIERVKRRVAEGGHNIAESIIRSRQAQSHPYLKRNLHYLKRFF